MAKLAAIGDSLVQGARSLAVSQTEQSFPALIAGSLGLRHKQFRCPNFSGCGGLPFNLEWMARQMERYLGGKITGLKWLGAAYQVARLLDKAETYWERGRGAQPVQDRLYHNLGIWNFQVCDAYTTTARLCNTGIGRERDEWFEPPSHGRLRIARRVLCPDGSEARQDDTQLDVLRRISQRDGGIDHLIVLFGANNALPAVWGLAIKETGPASPGPGSAYTLWSESAFREEYETLAQRIHALGCRQVYVGTVPHVTQLPLCRGVMQDRGALPLNRHYFDYYTRVWIDPQRFDVRRDPHLTRVQAETVDQRIDSFNAVIREQAHCFGWRVVDLCRLIDELSFERQHGRPSFVLPEPIADLDLRFLTFDEQGRRESGGLISLDGVHPTLCGYGLVAQAYIEAIRESGETVDDIDFAGLRRWDSLISDAPGTLNDVFGMLEMLEKQFHLARWLSVDDDHGLHWR